MRDTTPEAARVQDEIFKRLSGAEKVRLAMSLSDNIRDIAQAGISRRNASASKEERRSIFFREFYGIEIKKEQGEGSHE